MVADEDTMLATVGAIYDAGLDPSIWPQTLERIAEMLDMASAAIGFFDAHARMASRAHARIDEQAVAHYADRYRFVDDVMDSVSRRPPGQAFSDEMVVPKHQIRRSRFYDEWCRPNGLEHAIQGFAVREADRSTFVVFGRTRHQEGFSAAEVDAVTKLLPHVARASRAQMVLQAAQVGNESTAAALDCMPQAVMLVDARARVLHANLAATRLLGTAGVLDAGPLGLEAGRPEQTARLRALVAAASRPTLDRAGGSMTLTAGGIRTLVSVLPCRSMDLAWIGKQRPTAVVIAAGPARGAAVQIGRSLETLFGLTPTEARIACLISEGLGMRGAAERAGCSRRPCTPIWSACMQRPGPAGRQNWRS